MCIDDRYIQQMQFRCEIAVCNSKSLSGKCRKQERPQRLDLLMISPLHCVYTHYKVHRIFYWTATQPLIAYTCFITLFSPLMLVYICTCGGTRKWRTSNVHAAWMHLNPDILGTDIEQRGPVMFDYVCVITKGFQHMYNTWQEIVNPRGNV